MTRQRSSIAPSLTLIGLLWIFSAPPLAAQTENGEIVGTVKDSSGGVVAGAMVTARNLDTNIAREISTDSRGNYALPALRIQFGLKFYH